jgi:hypothetical protein
MTQEPTTLTVDPDRPLFDNFHRRRTPRQRRDRAVTQLNTARFAVLRTVARVGARVRGNKA